MTTSTATYCPEDNKIRLYVGRVPRPEYERLCEAGYKSTPKQGCDFVATWTPTREDLAREYLEEGEDIGDEDYSPQERAEDRAERFAGYRDKRRDEAISHADNYDAGPSVHGHQNQARAERSARKHDRSRTRAVSQWDKAEYWQRRTAGVISSAKYKSQPKVRRTRILKLEAEIRKIEASYTPKEPDKTILQHSRAAVYSNGEYDRDPEPHIWVGQGRGGSWVAVSALEGIRAGWQRWLNHLRFRIEYETAMLGDEGGRVADADMVPGGFVLLSGQMGRWCLESAPVGWAQILKVHKSPATKRVTSVVVIGTLESNATGERIIKPAEVKVNVERLSEDHYRAPTPEELEAFKAEQKAAKKAAKASNPKAPGLINPTLEDAQRLQDLWNEDYRRSVERYNAEASYNAAEYKPVEVVQLTQKQYSANSGGTYSACETIRVSQHGRRPKRRYGMPVDSVPVAFKVRKTHAQGHGFTGAADAVIVITDKPAKPLPLDWAILEGRTREEAAEAITKPAEPAPTGQLF